MIVGPQPDGDTADLTLDDLFRRAAVSDPDGLALVDPPYRSGFTTGTPKTLTFADADRAIWSTAARLRSLGLLTDDIVAFQLPNVIESAITLLGIQRAGMIAVPLPMLWRESEIVAALSELSAKVLLTAARINDADHCAIAMNAAAGLFSIRHVCAFGSNLPHGVAGFDNLPAADAPLARRRPDESRHAAVITFETTARGPRPVLRNHHQLIAAGLAALGGRRFRNGCSVLSAIPLSSFAGLALTVVPWLRLGGPLVLHQPFDADSFFAQQRQHGCGLVSVPGPLAAAVARHIRENEAALDGVLGLWRAPDRPGADETADDDVLVDVEAFGEYGLRAKARRRRAGDVVESPALVTQRSPSGTLLLSGAMAAPAGLPGEDTAPHDTIDTGYPCHGNGNDLVVSAAQPAMVTVGGYRIPRADIEAIAASLPSGSVITPLPDALLGQKLTGTADDPAQAERSLAQRGSSPLISHAFRRRGAAAA
jgi:hypothetical protein